jgi:hypothetical protein
VGLGVVGLATAAVTGAMDRGMSLDLHWVRFKRCGGTLMSLKSKIKSAYDLDNRS